MKIYRIDVRHEFRPDHQSFVWPPQNRRGSWDFGVEQDFDAWLRLHTDLLCDQPVDADWIYAPIFYNRYYINTPDADGHWGGGVEALAEEVHRCRQFGDRVFTISEADERVLHPQVDWGDMVMFCASRRQESNDIDIPLLAARHTAYKCTKEYMACFQGNLQTDGLRMQMRDALSGRSDCKIEHAGVPSEEFSLTIARSYIALAPRGQGAQSYRFYEAMDIGTVPLYISDLDCRPFASWIDWGSCSLWVKDTEELSEYIDKLSTNKAHLGVLGRNAYAAYNDYLRYGKWCKFVIWELLAL